MRSRMLDDIVGLLGGRVAENLIFHDISTGASNDIERASEIARKMVTKYGMSEKLGPIAFGKDNDEVFIGRDYNHIRNYSEAVASEIDEEVERIILDAYKRTEAILTEHMDKLHVVAKALVEREKIDADEFYALMDGKELPPLKAKKEDAPQADDEAQNGEQPEDAAGEETPTENPSETPEESEAPAQSEEAKPENAETPDEPSESPSEK